ncbi:MAG TPA: histidine kinase [Myxococcaceae bacterium]|jgi:hypothetical protein
MAAIPIAHRTVVRQTLRALLEPRRAGPLLLVGVALVIAETVFDHSYRAGAVASTMALATAAAAPCGWRLWLESPRSTQDRVWGVIAYLGLAVAVLLVTGLGLARVLQVQGQMQFLFRPQSLLICFSLFVVAGWGVGRDISMEGRVAQERARADALAREAERAQLLAIRSNLDPHFLFNTLNAIAEWCHQDSGTAEAALLQLSAMLRTIFDGVREPTWTLARELELVRALFDMHRLRDPQRFDLEWDVPSPAPAVQVPPLLLLPLAENAMKHGPGAGHTGAVRFSLRSAAAGVTLELTNPGPFRGPREGGSGLPTLQRRLTMAYGTAATLAVADEGGRTRVRLELPPAPEAGLAT